MNIAFPAIFIVVLTLPGIILRGAYSRGLWGERPNIQTPILEQIVWSFVTSPLLHALWIWLGTLLFGLKVDWFVVLGLLSMTRGEEYHLLVESASAKPQILFNYFFSLYAFSFALGMLLHILVRNLRLDHKYPLFRFNDPWFYRLRGEITQFEDIPEEPATRPPDIIKVAAVMEQNRQAFLYYGRLVGYTFGRSGELQTIEISEACRRLLMEDPASPHLTYQVAENGEQFYRIHGDHFILKYSELKNLNLEYYWLNEYSQVDETRL